MTQTYRMYSIGYRPAATSRATASLLVLMDGWCCLLLGNPKLITFNFILLSKLNACMRTMQLANSSNAMDGWKWTPRCHVHLILWWLLAQVIHFAQAC